MINLEDKTRALRGQNNKRLKIFEPLNTQINAALTDVSSLRFESNVIQPSIEGVEDAKEWVDNGNQM